MEKHAEAEDQCRQTDAWKQQGDVAEPRQKTYKTLAKMSAALTGPLLFDWQRGQGFQSVPASHLHLLIKCHNNMIFTNQQAPVGSLRRAGAVSLS